MNQEMLEILIGRYIDSEITPAEQRLLHGVDEVALEADHVGEVARRDPERETEAQRGASERGDQRRGGRQAIQPTQQVGEK